MPFRYHPIRQTPAGSGRLSRDLFQGLIFCLIFLCGSAFCLEPRDPSDETAKPQDQGQDQGEKRPSGLLEVAHLESIREKGRRDNEIRKNILNLGIFYSNPDDTEPDFIASSLAHVRDKRNKILAYRAHAVPHLIAAMESTSGERSRINAGKAAAFILAEINDPRVESELKRLLSSDGERTRANAIRCIGAKGLIDLVPQVTENLQSKNEGLLAATLVCLGRLAVEDLPALAEPFLRHPSPRLKTAALDALNLQGKGGEDASSLVREVLEKSGEPTVQKAAIKYLMKHGGPEGIEVLIEKYRGPHVRRKEQHLILSALTAIGMRADGDPRKEIVEFLNSLLQITDFDTVRKVANYLHSLGDDSGVSVLIAPMDKLIAKHGNPEYYFRRGEIYLHFKIYKKAKHDFLDGLRKDKKAGRYGAQNVFIALARCYAAESKFTDAERYIRKAELKDPSMLPDQYSEFEKMAGDSRFQKVFYR